jgi:hypothetical protein
VAATLWLVMFTLTSGDYVAGMPGVATSGSDRLLETIDPVKRYDLCQPQPVALDRKREVHCGWQSYQSGSADLIVNQMRRG